jgi:hypothetical protein
MFRATFSARRRPRAATPATEQEQESIVYPTQRPPADLSNEDDREITSLLDDLRERRIDFCSDGRTLIPVSRLPVLDDGLVERLQRWRPVLLKILLRPTQQQRRSAA